MEVKNNIPQNTTKDVKHNIAQDIVRDTTQEIAQEIADEIIAVLPLRSADAYITKIYNRHDIDIIIEKVCRNLFNCSPKNDTCYRYNVILNGIRKLFVDYPALSILILTKLEKLLESQYITIDLLIIEHKCDRIDMKFYDNHSMNVRILKRLGEAYNNFPITKGMQMVICMCYANNDVLKQIFHTNNSFKPFILKHLIYTRNISLINKLIRSASNVELLKIIDWLDEPYNNSDVRWYIDKCNNIIKTITGITPYTFNNFSDNHLHDCLSQLLSCDNIAYLCSCNRDIIIQRIKFFERCCYRFEKFQLMLTESDRRYIGERCKGMMNILTKISIAKYMEKFGKYESPDNLNERHLADLIATFVR